MCMIYRGLFLVECAELDLVACRGKRLFLKRWLLETAESVSLKRARELCAAPGGAGGLVCAPARVGF